MSKKSPPPAPPPPNPTDVARAQTGSNVTTAQANTAMGNANENGPLGSVKYNISGYQSIYDPTTGSTYQIPRYERNTTLSPNQQKLLTQQEQLGMQLNTIGSEQAKRIGDLLSKPMDTNGLPEQPGDFEPYRAQVESGLMERMNPQIDRDRNAMEQKLTSQGIMRGSEAWDTAMGEMGQQANDARTRVFLASGQEARDAGTYQGDTRARAFQERVATRNQPINEISALMNGGQASLPQFQPYHGGQMSETPVGQYTYQSANLAQDAWAKELAANAQTQGQIWNAVGSAVGAGIFKWSDRRLKRDVAFSHVRNGRYYYRFRYLWSDDWHVGVMAQENLDIAVMQPNGYYAVDYSQVL